MATQSVFYSWQNDSDVDLNHYFIEQCLKLAIKKINREGLSELVVDRDTKNVPGMVDIGNTIQEKIDKATVVVADLTVINPATVRRDGERAVPNPNALFELGYAYGKLGANRLIGIVNTAFGEVEELPFDLRPKRMMKYRLAQGDVVADARQRLVDALVGAIKQCLGETTEEFNRAVSRIHMILKEVWLIGSEIDDWYGIPNLPTVLNSLLTLLRELPDLLPRCGYSDDAVERANYMIHCFEESITLRHNDENRRTIKEKISSAGNTVNFINHYHPFNLDKSYHDELVATVVAAPSALGKYAETLQQGQLQLSDLEKLSLALRKAVYKPVLPEHPKFGEKLAEVTLLFRRHVLRWVKKTPETSDVLHAIQGIGEQLTDLIGKYIPENTSK